MSKFRRFSAMVRAILCLGSRYLVLRFGSLVSRFRRCKAKVSVYDFKILITRGIYRIN